MTVTAIPRGTTPAGRENARAEIVVQLPVDLVDIGPNVRVNVEAIDELAASIAEHGVLQPIKVRDAGERYVVVWGQRRLLAARQAGLPRIPSLVIHRDDEPPTPEQLSIEQLVENLHRADLPPLDRARAMKLVVESGMTQAELARTLGIAPSTVANDVGLLDSPDQIKAAIEAGRLTPAHAKALKGLAPKTQLELAKQAIARQASAHALEELVQGHKRQEEWRKQREADERKRGQAAAAALEASVEQIKKKKIPTDAVVYVLSDTQNADDNSRIAKLVREGAGFANVQVVYRYAGGAPTARPKGGLCDCTAWKIEERSSYNGTGDWVRKLSLTPACVKRPHQRADQEAKDKVRSDTYEHRQKVRAAIAGALAGQTARMTAPRPVLEALLWQLLDYRLGDWAAENGGKRGNPWATIRGLTDRQVLEHLGKELGRRFDDHFSYKVDWHDVEDRFVDVRPKGEVNPAALRGVADRSSAR